MLVNDAINAVSEVKSQLHISVVYIGSGKDFTSRVLMEHLLPGVVLQNLD